MKRDKAIETVKEFPQEFELEDLIERLVFVEKVEKGLQQVQQGKTIPHEQTIGTKHSQAVITDFEKKGDPNVLDLTKDE